MIFTVFLRLTVNLQKTKKPKPHRNWFLINCAVGW